MGNGVRYDDLSADALVELMDDVVPLVEDMADLLLEEIRDQIRSAGEGPSAPGQPPASPTGVYLESWKRGRTRIRGTDVSSGVFSAARGVTDDESLAEILEHGGGKNKVAPRPHIRPALENAARKAERLVRRASP